MKSSEPQRQAPRCPTQTSQAVLDVPAQRRLSNPPLPVDTNLQNSMNQTHLDAPLRDAPFNPSHSRTASIPTVTFASSARVLTFNSSKPSETFSTSSQPALSPETSFSEAVTAQTRIQSLSHPRSHTPTFSVGSCSSSDGDGDHFVTVSDHPNHSNVLGSDVGKITPVVSSGPQSTPPARPTHSRSSSVFSSKGSLSSVAPPVSSNVYTTIHNSQSLDSRRNNPTAGSSIGSISNTMISHTPPTSRLASTSTSASKPTVTESRATFVSASPSTSPAPDREAPRHVRSLSRHSHAHSSHSRSNSATSDLSRVSYGSSTHHFLTENDGISICGEDGENGESGEREEVERSYTAAYYQTQSQGQMDVGYNVSNTMSMSSDNGPTKFAPRPPSRQKTSTMSNSSISPTTSIEGPAGIASASPPSLAGFSSLTPSPVVFERITTTPVDSFSSASTTFCSPSPPLDADIQHTISFLQGPERLAPSPRASPQVIGEQTAPRPPSGPRLSTNSASTNIVKCHTSISSLSLGPAHRAPSPAPLALAPMCPLRNSSHIKPTSPTPNLTAITMPTTATTSTTLMTTPVPVFDDEELQKIVTEREAREYSALLEKEAVQRALLIAKKHTHFTTPLTQRTRHVEPVMDFVSAASAATSTSSSFSDVHALTCSTSVDLSHAVMHDLSSSSSSIPITTIDDWVRLMHLRSETAGYGNDNDTDLNTEGANQGMDKYETNLSSQRRPSAPPSPVRKNTKVRATGIGLGYSISSASTSTSTQIVSSSLPSTHHEDEGDEKENEEKDENEDESEDEEDIVNVSAAIVADAKSSHTRAPLASPPDYDIDTNSVEDTKRATVVSREGGYYGGAYTPRAPVPPSIVNGTSPSPTSHLSFTTTSSPSSTSRYSTSISNSQNTTLNSHLSVPPPVSDFSFKKANPIRSDAVSISQTARRRVMSVVAPTPPPVSSCPVAVETTVVPILSTPLGPHAMPPPFKPSSRADSISDGDSTYRSKSNSSVGDMISSPPPPPRSRASTTLPSSPLQPPPQPQPPSRSSQPLQSTQASPTASSSVLPISPSPPPLPSSVSTLPPTSTYIVPRPPTFQPPPSMSSTPTPTMLRPRPPIPRASVLFPTSSGTLLPPPPGQTYTTFGPGYSGSFVSLSQSSRGLHSSECITSNNSNDPNDVDVIYAKQPPMPRKETLLGRPPTDYNYMTLFNRGHNGSTPSTLPVPISLRASTSTVPPPPPPPTIAKLGLAVVPVKGLPSNERLTENEASLNETSLPPPLPKKTTSNTSLEPEHLTNATCNFSSTTSTATTFVEENSMVNDISGGEPNDESPSTSTLFTLPAFMASQAYAENEVGALINTRVQSLSVSSRPPPYTGKVGIVSGEETSSRHPPAFAIPFMQIDEEDAHFLDTPEDSPRETPLNTPVATPRTIPRVSPPALPAKLSLSLPPPVPECLRVVGPITTSSASLSIDVDSVASASSTASSSANASGNHSPQNCTSAIPQLPPIRTRIPKPPQYPRPVSASPSTQDMSARTSTLPISPQSGSSTSIINTVFPPLSPSSPTARTTAPTPSLAAVTGILTESSSDCGKQAKQHPAMRKWATEYTISRENHLLTWMEMCEPLGLINGCFEEEIQPSNGKLLLARSLRSRKGMKLAQRGIPIQARPYAWTALATEHLPPNDEFDQEIASPIFHNDYYATCLWQLTFHPTKSHRDIKKDVVRTMRYHPMFESEEGLQCLTNILCVFSFKQPVIGYCQSMNLLAAALLLYFPEENSFWMLDRIVSRLLPKNYYTPAMLDLRADLMVLQVLLEKKMPRLAQHMTALHVDIAGMCVPWFMCLFIEVLPLETVFRVWDILLVEHSTAILFRTALAILYLLQDEILQCQETSGILQLLTTFPSTMYDCDRLMEIAHQRTCNIDEKIINQLRPKFVHKLQEEHLKNAKFLKVKERK